MYSFLINSLIIFMFLIFNPIYSIATLALLNTTSIKINYKNFSILFSVSFALFFFLRDWRLLAINADQILYMDAFKLAGDISFSDFIGQAISNPIAHGQEPLWTMYLILINKIVGNNVEIFIFLFYFTILFLSAFLSKLIHPSKFVIVIFCIIFVNPGFLINVLQVWRHTLALICFFIGIFLYELDSKKFLSKLILFFSPLFHYAALPLIIFYWLLFRFIDFKNTKITKFLSYRVFMYAAVLYSIVYIFSQLGDYIFSSKFGLPSLFSLYQIKSGEAFFAGFYFLFNPLTIVVLAYTYLRRNNLSQNDIFIIVNYFIFSLAMIFIPIPTAPLGRLMYFFLVGASIIAVRLKLFLDFRISLVCLFIIIWHQFFNILPDAQSHNPFKMILNGEYLNPFYGVAMMIFNYENLLFIHPLVS